tara:strand:- start:742 stop:1188 length:447 start_codon:yes stop_codon:yes gene_type:complete
MKNLTTILAVLLISTQGFSQEYKESRTIGLVDTKSEYNHDSGGVDKESIKNNLIISFVILSHNDTKQETMKIYLDDGNIETTMELFITEKILKSESRKFITYMLYSELTGIVGLYYDKNWFSLKYRTGIKIDGELDYTKSYSGSILAN